jgi:hypothetical protein
MVRSDHYEQLKASTLFASGGYAACGVIQNTVVCINYSTDQQIAVPDGLQNPKQIVVGDDHACALTDQGVKCWAKTECWISPQEQIRKGHCSQGQWGQANVPSGLHGLSKVAVGGSHSCAIVADGVKCWGANSYRQLEVPSELHNPSQISAGENHTCISDDDGVKCWGSNFSPDFSGFAPVKTPKLINVSQIVSNDRFSCALSSSGVNCWGYFAWRSLYQDAFVPPTLKNPSQIAAGPNEGAFDVCAITEPGVLCWGYNTNSQRFVQRMPLSILNPKLIAMTSIAICVANENEVQCVNNSDKDAFPNKVVYSTPVKNPTQLIAENKLLWINSDGGLKSWHPWGPSSSPYIFEGLKNVSYFTSNNDDKMCVIVDNKLTCSIASYVLENPIADPNKVLSW